MAQDPKNREWRICPRCRGERRAPMEEYCYRCGGWAVVLVPVRITDGRPRSDHETGKPRKR